MTYAPKTPHLLVCLLLLVAAAGCGDSAQDLADGMSEIRQLGEAMSEMSEQVEQREARRAVEPVDFRELRALLPEQIGNMERGETEGAKEGAMGMTVSRAEATYQGEGDERLTIKITDAGAVPGFSMLGFGWAMAEIDRESSSGYERTLTYQGHKAHEQYNSDRRRGQMSALVADRFVVEVQGRGIEMDAVQDAMDEIDIGALEAMKDEGVKDEGVQEEGVEPAS